MAKLAACIIVGKNEAFELRRLLTSIHGSLFDEICVTTTQDDPDVLAVAQELATKVTSFAWIHDFSAARNFSFQQATSSHIMWLDSDDVIKPDNYAKLVELKKTLDKTDMVMMSYNYGHNDKDQATTVLPRERIVRNDQSRIKWHDAIHEYLNMDGGLALLDRKDIAVDHYRMKPFNASRNLDIHRKVYAEGRSNPRNLFYFAKDLIEDGKADEAIPIFEKYLAGPTDFADNKAVACIRLANYYKDKGDTVKQTAYLRKGMTYSKQYAEFPFMLGEYYASTGDKVEAQKYFEEAAGMPMAAGMSMQAEYYEFLPCDRLCLLHFDKGEVEKSLHYCERVLKVQPDNKGYLNNLEVLRNAVSSKTRKTVPAPTVQSTTPPVVGWFVPHFNPSEPSTRIRRLNIHKGMVDAGMPSNLLVGYYGVELEWLRTNMTPLDVGVFCQFSDRDIEIMTILKDMGKKVIVDYNENIGDNPMVMRALKLADLVVCCSSKLAELISPHVTAVAVVYDAVEEIQPTVAHDYFAPREKPVALYMGMGGNSFLVTDHLRDVIESAGYQLKVVTEWDNADEQWDLERWPDQLSSADVVLCPQRTAVQPAKSNVKVTQAMYYGIPVVASDLQAYREVIVQGKNGYICQGKTQWKEALDELVSLPKRIQVGMNGKDSIGNYLGASVVAKWGKVLSELMAMGTKSSPVVEEVAKAEKQAPREVVPIIIPVYNGLEYLKLCLSSIQQNTTYPYHIILSDAGSGEETWSYLNTLKGITVLGEPGLRRNFSEACNAGILHTGSKYFALLNSDVIVSRGWLDAIIEKMENVSRLAACGVLSNCDRGWLHGVEGRTPMYPMRLKQAGVELVPGMKYGEIFPHLDELDQFMNFSNVQNKGTYVEQPWVAAYATVYARSAVEDVGLFDTSFKNGCEDLDHCRRLKEMDYAIGQAIDSFVFHFGGISRSCLQERSREAYDAEDHENHALYARKWEKKRIVIYTGPAWEKWNRSTVDSGMAGSETWASELGAEFSRMGFLTTIFNDCPVDGEVDRDGVVYRHYSTLAAYLEYNYIDYMILSRTCEPMKQTRLHTNHTYVMVHDVWLHPDPNHDLRAWAVQKFAVLSDWHRDFFCQHHKVDPSKIMMTANGVREELYAGVDVGAKKNMAVYSSSADRGLYQLLQMLPRIRKEVPDFELVTTYGWRNWEEAAKVRGNPAEMRMIEELKEMLKQPGVRDLGRVSKTELAGLQKEAKVWLFPVTFEETFCIGSVENGMAKNALVTTPYAGLLTTLGDTPSYIQGPQEVPVGQWAYTPVYQDAFVAETVKLLTDEPYRQACAEKSYAKVKDYTWKSAADGWLREWGLTAK